MPGAELSWMQINSAWAGLRTRGSHAWHEFIIVVQGEYRVRLAEGLLKAGPHEVVCFPAGLVHEPAYDLDGSVQLAVLMVPADWQVPPDTVRQVTDERGRLMALAAWMRCCGESGEPDDRATLDLLARVFLREYQRLGRGGDDRLDIIRRARVHMQNSLKTSCDMRDLTNVLGVSHSTLFRLFMRKTGRSPMQHLREMRAEAALHLVNSTDLTMQEIAGRIGLSDPQSVTRLLAACHGAVPRRRRGGRATART